MSGALALEGGADQSGLKGILGKEVPYGLTSDSFSGLTGNWSAWGKDLSGLVSKLYTDDKLDAAGQRDLLKQLKRKIGTIDKALADPAYASLTDALVSVRGRLARRVDVANAILNTLELKPADAKAARVKAAGADALDALSALESDLQNIPNGAAWLPYIKANELRSALSSGKTNGVVSAVAQKLNAGSKLSDPRQRHFLARSGFRSLAAALGKVQDAANASTSVDVAAERNSFAALVAALEGYEENATTTDTKKVHQTLEAAEKSAVDGGNLIDQAVREHYMNYNLQVVASDAALNKLVNDQQNTTGPVSDFILGANVSGTEWTSTNIGVALRPGKNAANFDLILSGTTQSSTVGSTDQANVYTQGYHVWSAAKPVKFDGYTIVTAPAQMTSVQPSNTTTGASTRMSGFPILGRIADSIAVNEANARRGESEAIAAQRLESRVLPEFDARVDQMARDVDNRLKNDLRKRLKQAGVLPEAMHVSSNESYLRFSAEVAGPNDLGGDLGSPASEPGAGVAISIHETLLNNAINQMKFAGQTMSDAQVTAELERFLSLVAGRPINFAAEAKKLAARAQAARGEMGPPPAPGMAAPGMAPPAAAPPKAAAAPAGAPADEETRNASFIFDKEDPIRFTIEDGDVKLIMRAGIKQSGKEDIPIQEITIPLRMKVMGPVVMIDRGRVSVPGGTLRSGVMVKKIETAIKATPVDAQIHIPRAGRPDVDFLITKIGAENGWLTIWAQ